MSLSRLAGVEFGHDHQWQFVIWSQPIANKIANCVIFTNANYFHGLFGRSVSLKNGRGLNQLDQENAQIVINKTGQPTITYASDSMLLIRSRSAALTQKQLDKFAQKLLHRRLITSLNFSTNRASKWIFNLETNSTTAETFFSVFLSSAP